MRKREPRKIEVEITEGIRMEAHPPSIQTFADLPGDHPFYAKVGQIASEWAHLEHVLDLSIWSLLGIESVKGACVTAQIMGVGPRCKAIASLGRIIGLSEPLLRSFRKLMSDSYNVADERARIVHDPWYVEQSSGAASQFKSMPYSDQRYGMVDISEEDIARTVGHIRALRDRALQLREAVNAEREASRRKP